MEWKIWYDCKKLLTTFGWGEKHSDTLSLSDKPVSWSSSSIKTRHQEVVHSHFRIGHIVQLTLTSTRVFFLFPLVITTFFTYHILHPIRTFLLEVLHYQLAIIIHHFYTHIYLYLWFRFTVGNFALSWGDVDSHVASLSKVLSRVS